MTREVGQLAAALGIAGCVLAADARAQESRQESIAQAQAAKATTLHAYEPGRVEAAIETWRRRLLEEPSGFYPVFDSVYSGGGFTPGGGYRYLFGENAQWHIRGLYSFKNYKLLETGVHSRGHRDGRLDFGALGGFRDATQVAFFGLGMDTSQDQRTNTRFVQTFAEGFARYRPLPFVVLGGALGFDDYDQRDPQGSYPAVGEVFTPAQAPGLEADITYVRGSGTAGIDTRPSPNYARNGGFYGVSIHNYTDLDDTYGFNRFDVDLVQHVPVMRETWVLSLRGRMQTILDDDSVVPFLLLPSLGSGSTLRAYQSWRFRDRHSILTSAEWRWFPNRMAFDMALFFDAGKVTAERSDLDFANLATNWGIGARLHGPRLTALRLDLARGAEGWNLVFSGAAPF